MLQLVVDYWAKNCPLLQLPICALCPKNVHPVCSMVSADPSLDRKNAGRIVLDKGWVCGIHFWHQK